MRQAPRLDAAKLASLASRPGVDPRVWLSLAVVTEVGFDPKEGLFADLRFVPTGEEETAYIGTNYAGKGFGEHSPLAKDDLVLVAVPGGDPGLGCIIIARWNSAADKPPAEFGDGDEPTKDRVLRVEPGQNLRIYVSGGGKVSIVAEEASTIELGAENLIPVQDGVVTGQAVDPFTGMPHWLLGNSSLVVAAKKGP